MEVKRFRQPIVNSWQQTSWTKDLGLFEMVAGKRRSTKWWLGRAVNRKATIVIEH
jgi:hypothetical protein